MIAMHREIMFIILMWRTEATEKTLSHGGKEGGKMEAGLLKKKIHGEVGGVMEF